LSQTEKASKKGADTVCQLVRLTGVSGSDRPDRFNRS
jgi:hypothetical protein